MAKKKKASKLKKQADFNTWVLAVVVLFVLYFLLLIVYRNGLVSPLF